MYLFNGMPRQYDDKELEKMVKEREQEEKRRKTKPYVKEKGGFTIIPSCLEGSKITSASCPEERRAYLEAKHDQRIYDKKHNI